MQKFWFRKPGVGWTSVPLPSSIGHSVVAPGLSPPISGLEEAGIWSQGSFSKSSSWLSHHFPTVNTFAQVKPLLLPEAHYITIHLWQDTHSAIILRLWAMRTPIQDRQKGQKCHTHWGHEEQGRLTWYGRPPAWALSADAWDMSVWLSIDFS